MLPPSKLSNDITQSSPIINSKSIPAIRFSNPNVQNNPHVYMAVYASIPVYEMMVRGVAVMRRRADSFMNATQILKVAQVEKSKRAKILDRQIPQSEHQKIQGGYGRFQGTWVPFSRARELATRFEVADLLAPLFEYLPGPSSDDIPVELVNISNSDLTDQDPLNSIINSSNSSNPSSNLLFKKRVRPTSHLFLPDDQHLQSGHNKKSKLNSSPQQLNPTSNAPPDLSLQTHSFIDPQFSSNLSPSSAPTQTPTPTYTPVPGPSSIHPIGPSHLKKFNPASRSHLEDALKTEKNIHALMSVFTNPSNLNETHLVTTSQSNADPSIDISLILDNAELEIDTPIDEHCHTALHWAAALARLDLVRAFLLSGADLHRGNNMGETPLVRATFVTNNFEKESFNQLLEFLYPSLWILDTQNRTILHHICLTANIRDRAESSRYYMECIFEWIVNKHGGQFETPFIDAVDLNGDTALNIAARVGNKHLVRMLLDVGADKTIGNKLGLKPTDFGVEGEETTTNSTQDTITSLPPVQTLPAPTSKSRDIIASLTTLINNLSDDFNDEMKVKTDNLEHVRAQLKEATRNLTEQRRQIELFKRKLDDLGLLELRLKKLHHALREEDEFDWTGRSEIDGRPAEADKAFERRGVASSLAGPSTSQNQLDVEPDPIIPSDNSHASLIYLLRLKKWYKRVLSLLRERIALLRGCNLEQEAKYLKVIGSFIGNSCLNNETKLELPHSLNQTCLPIQDVFCSTSTQDDQVSTHQNKSQENLFINGQEKFDHPQTSINQNDDNDHNDLNQLLNKKKFSLIDSKLLNQLMIAIESDGPELDLNRVAGFMQKVHSGLI
ncbi:hypothetical protein O181_065118 [Austropuccinia psidii MF-1]|uniref:HTH APSES-type domain-containing protein n=1 Tax=Austropuccinia psidii MF-1 TaxID=1389203 RepID=A0A9Q3EUS8_9BASI|nr:hypothetical protein [Austropuccinia psidii MF-1]